MQHSRWGFIIIGFVILTLYFQGINLVLDGVVWVIFALLFFLLAFSVAKFTKQNGLSSYGYTFHRGWIKNLIVGFLIGFGSWGMMYLVLFLLGGFEVAGFKSADVIFWLILQTLIGMFLGSTINDAIVRGYVFTHLRGRLPIFIIIMITSLIYALDDIWFEGFTLKNTLFSIILGIGLAYAYAKTNSIWFTTGLHWGLNVMYCLMYGLPGSGKHGGMLVIEQFHQIPYAYTIQIGATLLLLFLVIGYFKFRTVHDMSSETHLNKSS